jgi:hypothetical protein
MNTSAVLPFLGPIVAAIIAGAVAFLASVLSKEQKTSEFRQAWIDSLRDDLSELISIALQIGDELQVRHKRGEDIQALRGHLRSREPEFLRLQACKARIQLRLNPKEHVVLLNAVNAMSEPSEHDVKGEVLIAEGQKVLKSEWKRVKRGERVFFVTKWLSLIVFLIGIIIAVAMVWGKIRVVFTP